MRKKEAQSFNDDFSTSPKQRVVPATRPRRALNVNRFLRRQKLDSDFSQIPKSPAHASGAWRHSHTVVTFSIWDFLFWHLWMTHTPHVRVTPALMLHLINPCGKRKVLSLTKLKDKIYKTKSLGHYITDILLNKTSQNLLLSSSSPSSLSSSSSCTNSKKSFVLLSLYQSMEGPRDSNQLSYRVVRIRWLANNSVSS